uniref:Putative outer membrane adhesin like protein n=1 Tax=Psychrobacter sp. (strain PRwf-1) TaxID=349106 RepID=A5WEM5_PSYWF
MNQKTQLIINKIDSESKSVILDYGQTGKIVATNNMKISLVDAESGKPITNLKAKKSGDNLVIANESNEDILTIENYYVVDNVEIGTMTDAGFIEFTPIDSNASVVGTVSETSYTSLVAEMLNTSVAAESGLLTGISNTALWGGLGAITLGAAALSGGGSSSSGGTRNKHPESKDTAIQAVEDTVATGKLSSATDVDGDKLTYALADKVANGSVVVNADGSYSYTPNANFNGTDSFTYTISDGKGGVITQKASVTVQGVNDAPVSTNTAIKAVEDTAATGKLSPATDVDGDKLTYALADKAANGTVTISADGSYKYTPKANFNGSDSFTYTITDGTETITQTATITVESVNDLPVSKDTAIQAVEDTVATGKLSSATDVDGDKLTYALADKAANGSVVVNADGSYSYTPNKDFFGTDSFTYTISDGKGGVITQKASVTVQGVNDAPVSTDTAIKAVEDTAATGKLSPATDVDGDKLTYALADKAANGTVTISADGSYKYTPKANFNGSDSFTYTITDGTETITQTATITVESVNDLPVSKDTAIQAVEDTVATGKLSSATDVDGDKLTYALADKVANGSVVVNADGSYSYTPNANFNGTDSFTYTISDGKGGVITQKASVTVQGVNDAPVSTNTAIKAVEDTVATGKLSPATDVDGDKLTYALADKAANGTVVVNADGSYKYTPKANFNGKDSFTYTITDGTETITQTATITVAAVNDLPVSKDSVIQAVEDTVATGKLSSATDVDGDKLTYALADKAANGSVVVNADGSYSYTPNKDFFGTDSFTYTISDGKGGVITQKASVTVQGVNDAPVSTDTAIKAVEDTAATGKLSPATDVDGDKLTYALADKAANGTVVVNADGSYKYTPKANFNGSDSFTYTITDGTETITQTATITVAAVNDLPVSKDTAIKAVEDTVATGKLSPATDVDGDKLTYALADKAANGSVVVNADGSYSYTPNKDFFGTDSFTYTISDGKGGVITQKASVTVQGVNDAPVSTNTAIKAVEDTAATGKLSPATDVDGDKLTYALADKAANGTVVVNADGSYKYTPKANFNGKDSFTYTITDGTDTITKTATVTVHGISQVYNNELQEVFETSVVSEQQVLVDRQSYNSLFDVITFEITGDNASAVLSFYDPSNVISLSGSYELYGSASSSSGSLSVYSSGSPSYSKVLGSNLAPGKYTLYVDAYEYGSTINIDVLQYQDVERTEFTGYENVSGNIFADANISVPKDYILQMDGQSLASSEANPIAIETTKGTFELSADGSYNYLSKGSELGLDPKKLSEAFNIIVSDTKGNYLGVYRVEVEPDTTPPVPGKLVLSNFEDTGTSQDDSITQDNTFDLAVQGNEAGSAVEFEYSSDNGKTWSTIFNGSVSNLEDGEYSFRAKVTDEALNQSLTEVKTITIDTTAPVLVQILNFNTATNTLEVDANIDKATVKAYQLSNGSQTQLDSVTNIPFKEGNYRIEASDVAGNVTAIDFIMSTASQYFKSTDNIDIVKGSSFNDYIYGGNGDDILVAEEGLDVVYGEAGDDMLIASKGSHILYGGDGNDVLIDEDGRSSLSGGNGNDTLTAASGSHFLFGDSGNDILTSKGLVGEEYLSNSLFLSGGDGDDILILDGVLSNASATFSGGSGNNTFVIDASDLLQDAKVSITSSSMYDSVKGLNILQLQGVGSDDLVLERKGDVVEISVSGGLITISDQFSEWGGGVDNIYFDNGDVWDRATIESNIKGQWYGTNGDDTFISTGEYSVLFGLDGNDKLTGGINNDYIYGGNGDDILVAEEGLDVVYGEAGDDMLIASKGSHILYGGDGNDVLIDEDGRSSLSGGNGNDTLTAASGSHFLFGDSGNDILTSKGLVGEEYLSNSLFLSGGDGDDILILDGVLSNASATELC